MLSETPFHTDTIVALATPPAKGAIGIVRVSGSNVQELMKGILGFSPTPREACLAPFLEHDGSVIDTGIAIYFPAPRSYTGEDILELQGHGGIVVMDMLLRRLVSLGARMARPGEFTERAFLNNKIDLAQAEAIADLIESGTEKAARCAQRSMQGEFSKRINVLKDLLIELRMYTEASIDFVGEDIDFLSEGNIADRLQGLLTNIESVGKTARQGHLLRDGMTIVIAGRPNAGKSSLLNVLAGKETAIVTEWEGTTRDVLRESIQIDGMPLHIIDTAGLRETEDQIEKVGIERAYGEINNADRVLFIIDDSNPANEQELPASFPTNIKVTKVFNKIDLTGTEPKLLETRNGTEISISVTEGKGLDLLVKHLKQCVGYNQDTEAVFIARRRHLEALQQAEIYVHNAITALQQNYGCEILAEELRLAQNAVSEVTGEFTSEDLLGQIFSGFCIGK